MKQRVGIMVRWLPEHRDALAKIAAAQDTTVAELIRRAVIERYALVRGATEEV